MRSAQLAAVLAAFSCVAVVPALAQSQPKPPATTPAATPPAAADASKPADPVVARVGSEEIHLSETQEAAANVPAEYRQIPPQMLFPMVLDQVIDRHVVGQFAHKQGLDQDAQVKKAMERAAQGALENAAVARAVRPQVSDAAVKARYDAAYANKPGEEEVHARHILVASEDDAKKIIEELKKGGDFAAIAKSKSTDPGAAQGGDLGWFKKADMLPEFSAIAFSLKNGQISDLPVKTRYGWHVIKLEERRTAAPPSFEQAQNELRQSMIQEAVQKFVQEAKAGIQVEKFNPDGSVPKATDAAQPPGGLDGPTGGPSGSPAGPGAGEPGTDAPGGDTGASITGQTPPAGATSQPAAGAHAP